MILIAYICLTTIFMPIMYTIHKYGEWSLQSILIIPPHIALISRVHVSIPASFSFILLSLPQPKGTLISSKMASNYTDSSLSTSAFTMFHRSGASVNPIGISHHHLPPGDQRGDIRPILDTLSTSSTSTNNDSFLGAVNSNPTSRLLLGQGGGGKGRKKDPSSKKQKAGKSGQMRDQMQPIFSPQTASYHCEYPLLSLSLSHTCLT